MKDSELTEVPLLNSFDALSERGKVQYNLNLIVHRHLMNLMFEISTNKELAKEFVQIQKTREIELNHHYLTEERLKSESLRLLKVLLKDQKKQS